MNLFGKGFTRSNGRGRTNYYDGSGRYSGHTQTNSRGVTNTYDKSGKHTKTTGTKNFGKSSQPPGGRKS